MSAIPPEWPIGNDLDGKNDPYEAAGLLSRYFDGCIEGKVNGLALEKIALGQMLPLPAGLDLIAKIFPQFFKLRRKLKKSINKRKTFAGIVFREPLPEPVPIGILGNAHNNWVNALMQFILFVPALRSMFCYLPSGYAAFEAFCLQYFQDVKDRKPLTSAKSDCLMKCLYRQFGSEVLLKNQSIFNLYDILRLLLGRVDIAAAKNFLLDPAGHVICKQKESPKPMERRLEQHLLCLSRHPLLRPAEKDDLFPYPMELIISYSWLCDQKDLLDFPPAKMQYFFASRKELAVVYALDAFIFCDCPAGRYSTYIKANDAWHCAQDEKVEKLETYEARHDLYGAFLFHYKRMRIKKTCKGNLV